jgi:transposase
MTRLVYLDEIGADTAMTRLYGRGPKGERAVEYVPDSRFERYSILSAIRVTGETIPFVYPGTLKGSLFLQYIAYCVIPALKPHDILITDCLSPHRIKGAAKLAEAAGANVVYLPPCSPDFNPIETLWSELKPDLKKRKVRSIYDICDALTHFFHYLDVDHVENHFSNSFCSL